MSGGTEALESIAPGGEPLPPEEQARADFYALLARLYAAGPDADLLAAIAGASAIAPIETSSVGDDNGIERDLATAWQALAETSATTEADAATSEYNDLFIGVGKSELNLHASHWLTGFMMERPLAQVRATLARLGLARQERATVVEDHLAALCETMRILVGGGAGRLPASLEEQRAFFEQHIAPWVFVCCAAIEQCPIANYYRKVAQFTHCYLVLERESLAME